jgi:hypothetical protein
MSEATSSADALQSPVSGDNQSDDEPTPRLATPATEEAGDSVQRERDAVGDGPDVGGITPSDDAQ